MTNLLNFLICLVGLPSSGKSILAEILKKRLLESFNDINVIIVDPDKIRESLANIDFDYTQEKIIREKNLSLISGALKDGKIVISDDLNYYSSMRHDLKEIADNLSLNFFIIYISTPIEFCLKWNDNRGNKIPNEVIENVHDKFDYFDKYQWDKPFYEVDLSQVTDLNFIVDDIICQLIINLKESTSEKNQINNKSISSNIINERLESITRQTVGILLKNPKNHPFKEKILNLRKNFIKFYLNKSLNETEIINKFKKFIEKSLNKKLA